MLINNLSTEESVIELRPQECTGDYNFSATPTCTRGFANEFPNYRFIIAKVLKLIAEVKGPDYLQVFTINNIKCFAIASYERNSKEIVESENHVTFMLADEY